MNNFSYYFMEEVKDVKQLHYDVFISAFDGCVRTCATFDKIQAAEKKWIVFPQYEQKKEQLPESYLTSDKTLESEFIPEVFEHITLKDKTVCIDSTGFLIPHLVFLIQLLKRAGVGKYDIIYSEPASYNRGEETEFTKCVNAPRPIEGYSASAKNVNGNDALIIFSGFNDALVTSVARNKSKALYKYLFTTVLRLIYRCRKVRFKTVAGLLNNFAVVSRLRFKTVSRLCLQKVHDLKFFPRDHCII